MPKVQRANTAIPVRSAIRCDAETSI